MHYLNWSDIYYKYPIAMQTIDKAFDVVSFNAIMNSFIFKHTTDENKQYGEEIDIDELREFFEQHKIVVTPSIGYEYVEPQGISIIKYRYEVIDVEHDHIGYYDDYENRYECQNEAITMAIKIFEENICTGFIKL